MAEFGTLEVNFDTSELLEICRVTCFNTNCIYHAHDNFTCDKKKIVIDENGCVNSRDKVEHYDFDQSGKRQNNVGGKRTGTMVQGEGN